MLEKNSQLFYQTLLSLPCDTQGIDEFINAADNALYNSKFYGRNMVSYETPGQKKDLD
jgi:GGDEF domain-containing protein